MYIRCCGYMHSYISGSSLSRCAFNGQQCCGEQTLSLFGGLVGRAIDGGVFDFDAAFNGARGAINRLRSETGGTWIS